MFFFQSQGSLQFSPAPEATGLYLPASEYSLQPDFGPSSSFSPQTYPIMGMYDTIITAYEIIELIFCRRSLTMGSTSWSSSSA